jgi:hypothetical protein
MINVLGKIDEQEILNAYNIVEENIVWTSYGHKGRQAGLQFKDNEDPWTSAVGRSSGQESMYTNLNPFFKDTIFEEVINQYNLTRTRLMWVNPYACYSVHRDETPRIHIPLITNPSCYFVFLSGRIMHLDKKLVWWVDTRKTHTFMNCSDEPRLHLVGVVEK